MNRSLCRQAKPTSLRRNKRGISTVIGAVFFFAIAMTLTSFFYEVAQNQILMQQYDAQKVTENVDARLQILSGGGVNITLTNRGPIVASVSRLWVIDKTTNTHRAYTLDTDVHPWTTEVITSTSISGWQAMTENNEYTIKVVTSRGNILEPTPFTAVTGRTVSVTSYPPWVSDGVMAVSTSSSETPVPQISRNDKGDPYDGGKVWLSLKNTGSITFFLTFQTRIVFKNTVTGKAYASRLDKWEIFTWTGTRWDMVSSGVISWDKASRAVYPGNVFVVEFETPQEAPGHASNIPSGTYWVYLRLEGFDDNGKSYFQEVYYGTLTF